MIEEVVVAPEPDLGARTVELLRDLICIDTSNPPGNERELQELLRDLLAEAGFECELPAREPERPNLVARLAGASPGPTLCVLGHADTVPAERSDWSLDPWSGELRDGEVWGRGALDMKGQVASEVAACAALARSGWRPARGELLLVITADEERGARHGAQWLCEQRPALVRSDLVLNEGGGVALEIGGRRFYTIAVGEKGVFRFRLRTAGRAGHASLPRIGENALLKLAPLLDRFGAQPEPDPTPEAEEFLSALLDEDLHGAGVDALAAAVQRLGREDPAAAAFLAEPMLGVTLAPTIARAGGKENVIPAHAEILVDCRVPPERGEELVREKVEAVVGEGDYEIEFGETVAGNRSPLDTKLAQAIEIWLGGADPGARLVPIVMAGFSDSHWFRRAFGATVYGFCPHNARSVAEIAPLIHGVDERVAVADLELAGRFFFDLPQRALG